MLCPYCGQEMQQGCLQQDRGGLFTWVPKGREAGLFPGRRDKGLIRFGGYDGILGGRAKVFCCPDCRKLLVDLEDDEV